MAFLPCLLVGFILVHTATPALVSIPRTGWTATADSFQAGNEPSKAIDSSATTFWHSQYNPAPDPLPNWLFIDMKSSYNVRAISYTPRQDQSSNGNIGSHRIELSTDGTNWGSPVAMGTWFNDKATKTTTFVGRQARYLRLTALSEAQGAGNQWSSVAELEVLHEAEYVSRSGWAVSADSQETVKENSAATNAIDGNAGTHWHTRYGDTIDPLPHWFQIDQGRPVAIGGFSYLPRLSSGNGRIGNYTIQASNSTSGWTTVAYGIWPDNGNEKLVSFLTTAQYIRLNALSEAGNRGPWTSAGEINLLSTSEAAYTAPAASKGLWVNTVDIPLVPVAAAMLPSGKVLVWSSFARGDFGGSNGYTQTAIYDPATGESTQRTVTNTAHDMFCPGISLDFNGRIVVTGGSNAAKTSIYDPSSDGWIAGPDMQIARGYQSSTTCSDGRIFTIGGSWSGARGGKNGEIYSPSSNSWSLLPNALVSPMLTADKDGAYRADNHGWLFGWKNSTVFQAGPSKAMNWYDTIGAGSVTSAGNRGDDGDAMNGNAVMFDAPAGKILTAGGATNYQTDQARSNAYVITLGGIKTNPQVTKLPNMAYARGFSNGVALPDGTVFITGGQSTVEPFTDTTAAMVPELFNPATNTWTQLNPMAIPRTYHSVALLLPDATVFNGGGGLCGDCGTNHFDAEIFVPPYLLNADGSQRTRPVINTVAAAGKIGSSLGITTNVAVTKFALIRFGSATHTVDTDQRRIPLVPSGSGTAYTVTIPGDPGVALPGYYHLFAITSVGTPSVAKTIKLMI